MRMQGTPVPPVFLDWLASWHRQRGESLKHLEPRQAPVRETLPRIHPARIHPQKTGCDLVAIKSHPGESPESVNESSLNICAFSCVLDGCFLAPTSEDSREFSDLSWAASFLACLSPWLLNCPQPDWTRCFPRVVRRVHGWRWLPVGPTWMIPIPSFSPTPASWHHAHPAWPKDGSR